MAGSLYEREMQDEALARLVAQEDLIEEAAELIAKTMQRENLSKAQLARRVGTSKAHITQLLAGTRNMTLRTLADLMYRMGKRVLLAGTDRRDVEWERSMQCVVVLPAQTAQYKWKDSTLLQGNVGAA